MTELKKMKAYLTYPMDPKVRGILLTSFYIRGTKIIVGNKTCSVKGKISPTLANDLVKRFYARIEEYETLQYRGIQKVFGIYGTESRTIKIDGDDYIRIRVVADDIVELFTKVSRIKETMSKYGLKEKICMWDKMGKLSADPEIVEQPKKKVDFDMKGAISRRAAEIKTYRQK
ncbi:MAG: hypothetical protein M0R51_11565 [Clostridia bacterium]|jgi:hypothetical protein|nr:hypothetical protein [Clostridia bacterium]